MVLQLTLPERLSLGPWWLAPTIEAVLLFTLVVVGPTHLDAESRDFRIVALTVIGVLIVSDGSTLGLLVHHLLQADSNVSGRTLIYSAVAVWFTALVAFALARERRDWRFFIDLFRHTPTALEAEDLDPDVSEIGVAIVRPAEFVVFRLSQWGGPSS